MTKLILHSGFFYGAGRVFGWKGEHHINGVGVSMDRLLSLKGQTLFLEINGVDYSVNVDIALQFIEAWGSIKTYKKTAVGVFSRDLLTLVSLNLPTFPINDSGVSQPRPQKLF